MVGEEKGKALKRRVRRKRTEDTEEETEELRQSSHSTLRRIGTQAETYVTSRASLRGYAACGSVLCERLFWTSSGHCRGWAQNRTFPNRTEFPLCLPKC